MHFQTLFTGAWACILALLLAVNAAPVALSSNLTTTEVVQFRVAFETLKSFERLTTVYETLTNRFQNDTDPAFQSLFNQTMVSLIKVRETELKMLVSFLAGRFSHQEANASQNAKETAPVLQFNGTLVSPSPSELQMMFHLAKQIKQLRHQGKHHDGLDFAFVKASVGAEAFNGTIVFNGADYVPHCYKPPVIRCLHSFCPPSWYPCLVRNDQRLDIIDVHAVHMPDIVMFNNIIYQPRAAIGDNKVKDSAASNTQRGLEDKTDTANAHTTPQRPGQCVPYNGPMNSLPICPIGRMDSLTGLPVCPNGYWRQVSLFTSKVTCILEKDEKEADAEYSPAPSSKELNLTSHALASNHEKRNHTIFLPDQCAPRYQPDAVKGLGLCPEVPSVVEGAPESMCPYMYTLEHEKDGLVCYITGPGKGESISKEQMSPMDSDHYDAKKEITKRNLIGGHPTTKLPGKKMIPEYRAEPRDLRALEQKPCPHGISWMVHGQLVCVPPPEAWNTTISHGDGTGLGRVEGKKFCPCWFLGCFPC